MWCRPNHCATPRCPNRPVPISSPTPRPTTPTPPVVTFARPRHCTMSSRPPSGFCVSAPSGVRGGGRDHDGMLRLWARLDPETGAGVEAVLEPLRRALWQADKHVRTGRRTPAQRDADTLAYALAGITLTDEDAQVVDDLAARARQNGHVLPSRSGSSRTVPELPHSERTTPPRTSRFDGECEDESRHELELSNSPQAGEPMRRFAPAQINVLIGLDALRGDTDHAGVTDAGTELAPETVRRLACDSEIIPIILGGRGGPADIGRTRRTVPTRLRRLLVARDKHCVWPGCHRTALTLRRPPPHPLGRGRPHRPRQPRAAVPHPPPAPPTSTVTDSFEVPTAGPQAAQTSKPSPAGSRRPARQPSPAGSRRPARQPRAP